MVRLGICMTAGVVSLFIAATIIISPAQSFDTIATFDGSNGAFPQGVTLVQGPNGSLYGATSEGGTGCNYLGLECGTIFETTTDGQLKTVYSFSGSDGEYPISGLVLGTDGNFYGVTSEGGAKSCALSDYGCGTIFKITPNGALTTLYNFCSQAGCADGGQPLALLQASDGAFYGATYLGGANCLDQFGSPCGTVFKFSAAGGLTTLYSFCKENGCTDGAGPAGLVQGRDGNFYGATSSYGATGFSQGTVFKITSDGALSTLYSFCSQAGCPDGEKPAAGLIQASGGEFYGTTSGGGSNAGTGHGGGTIFSITTLGKLTTLYNFCSRQVIGPQLNHGEVRCIDGSFPTNVLLQGSDGNLYGTTSTGGGNGCGGVVGCGTIFKVTPQGALTTLLSFDGGANGISPQNGLVQATSGSFYGLTVIGGDSTCGVLDSSCGTTFSLNAGLGPFVAFIRGYGKVGQTVGILGQGFTGTTEVSFNGTPAKFTVVSGTFIEATVPAGASSGYVKVATPDGTLKSNVAFRVIQ